MEFKEKLRGHQDRIEKAIDRYLPAPSTRPSRIHEAMLYSMKAGGKRLRPVLALAACDLFADSEAALPAAIALECLHTYSLVHDDLPSIDDGDLRRGNPTCHKQFDEATAVLAGDALLTYSIQLLCRSYRSQPEIALKLVDILSDTAGSEKLIGGQMEDILGESAAVDEEGLKFIHLNKTSALIEASLEMGAVVGKATSSQIQSIRAYGRSIGLAFQVIDDILDATSDAATLGKDIGSDANLEKTTYISLYGLEKSRAIAEELSAQAIESCHELPGDAPFLVGLAKHLSSRLS